MTYYIGIRLVSSLNDKSSSAIIGHSVLTLFLLKCQGFDVFDMSKYYNKKQYVEPL